MYSSTKWLLCFVTFLLLAQEGLCFGAGKVGEEIKGHAFLHGDIEKILLTLTGVAAFTKREVDAIYFGNWLRDYSQAMDTKGLGLLGDGNESMATDAIMLVIQVLGFMTFGFATRQFKITAKKLGVYSHAEHMDNPKGYPSDAKKCHKDLRGEVFKDEYAVDPETGMKNYIAHEGQGYDTSAAYIRKTLKECIAKGRRSQRKDTEENHEALRLLGSALHTLEDFLAHTNWCELVIRKLTKADVFCFAGAKTYIPTKDGEKVPPLVTGTFGGADFLLSVFGSVDDHLCSHSSGDIQQKIRETKGLHPMHGLNKLLHRLAKTHPTLKGHMDKLEEAKRLGEMHRSHLQDQLKTPTPLTDVTNAGIKEEDAAAEERRLVARKEFLDLEKGLKTGTAVAPITTELPPSPMLQAVWDILEVRDEIMRTILDALEEIGLKTRLEEFQNMVNATVWTIIANMIEPAVDSLAGAATHGHEDVLHSQDQTEVFRDPTCSDPTHSWLAKDHFKNALHMAAAKTAEVVVKDCVTKVTEAWKNDADADPIIDQILEAFHHPYFPKRGSIVQANMMTEMEEYLKALGDTKKASLLGCLTLEAVHEGLNVREVPKNPATTSSQIGELVGEIFNFGVHVADDALDTVMDALDTAEEVADDIKKKAGELADKAREIANDIEQTADELERKAEEAAADVVEAVEEITRDAEKLAEEAATAAEKAVTEVQRELDDAAEAAERFAEETQRDAEKLAEEAARAAEELAAAAQREIDEAAEAAKRFAEEAQREAEKLAEEAVRAAEELAAAAQRELEEAAEAAKRFAEEAQRAAEEKAAEIQRALDDAAREAQRLAEETAADIQRGLDRMAEEASRAAEGLKDALTSWW
ncbi:heterokaryon incompatibility protein Het-C-domain-containing protein [Crucibulum laeve]|uniref:Heterokaryon incompatibility protein Het-C-domain-containing protein n=1 Tax=Crucibulum laeve TaxID=68775 RepID=A0A5C3M3D9_9AGAR|nr:heterokaryon incompatibility protein Het-C-domain-containing protein [Crucibulum laeve]